MCIGGPALVMWVTPTEDELRKVCFRNAILNLILTISVQRYNPDLQKRSLENRQQKQEDFDQFVGKLKEYSKSDQPSKSALFAYFPTMSRAHPTMLLTSASVWAVQAQQEAQVRAGIIEQQKRAQLEQQRVQDDIKAQAVAGR